MSLHQGEHARFGATDVCPFVPVSGITMEECAGMARRVGARIGEELGIPVYLYENAASRPEWQNLAKVRAGHSIGFDADSIGCFGGKRYLGFGQALPPARQGLGRSLRTGPPPLAPLPSLEARGLGGAEELGEPEAQRWLTTAVLGVAAMLVATVHRLLVARRLVGRGRSEQGRVLAEQQGDPAAADVVKELEEEFQEEAAECASARAELAAAKTDAEFDRALMKVDILCNN